MIYRNFKLIGSYFTTIPSANFGVVVLANKSGFNADPSFESIVDSLLKLPMSVKPPITSLITAAKKFTMNKLLVNDWLQAAVVALRSGLV
ncbi:hypothetical protein H6G06_17530 [Anabaena sphaerica FACHB-251]|uniref:Uncharacterized protein n=1 Tax=Anabaena sphaerica FACHB-251 TaxID=2692883 RepID=A0A926WIJ2_9NOST|nr:hypothetical protein [Anabaena sphaerica]MBD2295230.1 hypothetical protein [Anabaena sphaerica FACHB-251]